MQKTVCVVGGGLAGIIGALAAKRRGAKVVLISSGPGTFAMSGGIISTRDLDLKAPCLEEAMAFFADVAAEAGCEYKGEFRGRQLIPNVMGSFQEVSMAPTSIWSGNPANGAKVMVLGIRGLSAFSAGLIAETLDYSAAKRNLQVEYTSEVIDVPWLRNRCFSTLDLANLLDDRQHLDELAEIVKPLVKGYSLVLLPAIFGQKTGGPELARFSEKAGCSVAELNTVPPSAVGLRIFQCLLKYVQKAGVEINLGYPVRALQLQAGRCTAAVLDTPGRKRAINADAFILAAGIINRVDLVINDQGENPIWNLPEEIAVNEQMQLLNQDMLPLAANIYGAGSILGGFAGDNGNAQAILTGYQAGIIAAGVTGGC